MKLESTRHNTTEESTGRRLPPIWPSRIESMFVDDDHHPVFRVVGRVLISDCLVPVDDPIVDRNIERLDDDGSIRIGIVTVYHRDTLSEAAFVGLLTSHSASRTCENEPRHERARFQCSPP